MSLRLLLGILAPGPPGQQQNDSQSSEIEIRPQDKDIYATIEKIQIIYDQTAVKFHIGMLSISLIIGLAFIGFTIWWMEKKPFLGYVINLIVALVCRTFFSILFDGVILLGSGNVGGGNALLAFEQIFINLVLAFWLSLTIYIHARVQRNFNSEPTLNLYKYGLPGVAVFFAFIWIFLLQAEFPYDLWWFHLTPSTQWVVNSFNLLCVFIQLALVGDIARIMMKTSLDNDSLSLFRKVSILMGVLVFVFWLQFGLFIGRLPLRNSSSYIYTFYFVDGIECAVVCLILYFFNNWVVLYSDSRVMGEGSVDSRASNQEFLAGGGGRGIVTLDSVFMTNESGTLRNSEEEGDVVYSNVVDPQRWEKILDLYKRLNKIPNQQGTVVEGDEFFECPLRMDWKMSRRTQRSISVESRKRMSSEDGSVYKNDKLGDQIPKKNAFYSSKYLILDSKCDVPKYLETRPSFSSGFPVPGLATKADVSDKPGEVRVSEPPELLPKPETTPPWRNEKFWEENRILKPQIIEQNHHEPKQSDAKGSEPRGTYLSQYLTNSELQERRLNREKWESDQRDPAPKSIFSLPETISSMVGYFVNGRSSVLGPRTDPKLSNTENTVPTFIRREAGKVEESSVLGPRTDPKLSNTENIVPTFIRREAGKAEMKHKTQFVQPTIFEQQSSKPTAAQLKAFSEEERLPMKKISISSGSEFSIEGFNDEQPRQELGISRNEKLPVVNPWLPAAEQTHRPSERTIEPRKTSSSSSGSFSLEEYYQQLSNNSFFKQKQSKQTLK